MSAVVDTTGAATGDLAVRDEHFDALTKTNAFLPRMELFTGKRNLVASGKFPMNHFGMVKGKNQITDLGLETPAYILDYRYRAINFKPADSTKLIESSFDPTSDLFKAIKTQADKKMPEGQLNDCIAGIEWLLIHPTFKAVTLMCASKSWKAICESLRVYMTAKKFVKFSSFFKTAGKFSWQSPSVEMLEKGDFPLPPDEELAEIIEFFKNQDTYITEKDLEGDVKVTDEAGNPVTGGR